MLYSALVRLFVAILRKISFPSPSSPRLTSLAYSKRLWALFLLTAQRLFGFESSLGPDGLSPSLDLPSTKAQTPESPHVPIVDLPISPAVPLHENKPSPTLHISAASCFTSALPEQYELDTLNQAERGDIAHASVSITEMPLADGVNYSQNPAESLPEVEISPADGFDEPQSWEMESILPELVLGACMCI